MTHGTPNPVDVLEYHVLRPLAAATGRQIDEGAVAAARAYAGAFVPRFPADHAPATPRPVPRR